MASLCKEIVIDAPPAEVWDALRDVGALHTLVPGFVTDTRVEGEWRSVRFGNGMQVRERIVDLDDAARRLVWSVVGPPFEHHNGVAQVFAEPDGRSRLVWRADLLPQSLAAPIGVMMEQGIAVMKQTLDRS
jgi:uncharacterized protein YndB with AHSA1/START domain